MSQRFSPDLSDAELVHLCQARGFKDDRPFQELFRRYQRLVWHVCFNYTGNPQDAEDLTQEVFFKVYRGLDGFEGRSAFKSWLYRIAVNTCQNEIRSRKSRPQTTETDVDTMAEILPDSETVESVWQRRSEQEQLATALLQLRPSEHEVLQLKDLEQLPYAEIAKLLNISVSAAKMRVQRARLALQTAFRKLEEVE